MYSSKIWSKVCLSRSGNWFSFVKPKRTCGRCSDVISDLQSEGGDVEGDLMLDWKDLRVTPLSQCFLALKPQQRWGNFLARPCCRLLRWRSDVRRSRRKKLSSEREHNKLQLQMSGNYETLREREREILTASPQERRPSLFRNADFLKL